MKLKDIVRCGNITTPTPALPIEITPIPQGFEETNLNDEEISEVLSYLLELQENYFPDSPLSDELCKKFVWNIPRDVYKSFKDSKDYGSDAAFNIMTLFYAMCMDMETPICVFLKALISDKLLGNQEVIDIINRDVESYECDEDDLSDYVDSEEEYVDEN